MHPALTKDDILVEIFSHLSLVQYPPTLDSIQRRPYTYWGPVDTSSSRRLLTNAESDEDKLKRTTLASAALSCKAFSERALDELWTAPRGGMYTLLGLLSGFTKKLETQYTHRFGTKAHSVSQYILEGEITPEDWAVLLRYAERVREFAFHTYRQPAWVPYYIDPSVFDVLRERLSGRPLLPRLRYLAWQATAVASGTSLRQFFRTILIAPSLSVLAFWDPLYHGGGSAFEQYWGPHVPNEELDEVVASCSGLTQILFEAHFELPSNISLIADLDKLYTVEIIWPSWDTLTHLGRLPRLLDLRVGLRHIQEPVQDDPALTEPEPLRGQLFPALRRVSLLDRLVPTRHITRLLAAISSRSLTSLTFHITTDVDLEVRECIHTLCALPFRTTLRALDIVWTSDGYPLSDSNQNGQRAIEFMALSEPLLHLPNLQSLSFIVQRRSVVFVISDEVVERMALAWPHISSLTIMNFLDQHPPAETNDLVAPKLSLAALVSLAEQCRQLETLRMPVRDVSDDELHELENRTPSVVPQEKLMEVALSGGSWSSQVVSDVARLTQAMRRVFPNVNAEVQRGGEEVHGV